MTEECDLVKTPTPFPPTVRAEPVEALPFPWNPPTEPGEETRVVRAGWAEPRKRKQGFDRLSPNGDLKRCL